MDSAQMSIKATASVFDAMVEQQFLERLQTLRRVSSENGNSSEFGRFLEEVDAALKRYEDGTYGICEECHESMGAERMLLIKNGVKGRGVRLAKGEIEPRRFAAAFYGRRDRNRKRRWRRIRNCAIMRFHQRFYVG